MQCSSKHKFPEPFQTADIEVDHVFANFSCRSTMSMKVHYSCLAIREQCQIHSSEIKERTLQSLYFIFCLPFL